MKFVQPLPGVTLKIVWERLLSAFEEFPGHAVLKFPDKANWAFAFMFNVLSLTQVLKGGGDRPDGTGAADKQVDGVSFRCMVDQILSAF